MDGINFSQKASVNLCKGSLGLLCATLTYCAPNPNALPHLQSMLCKWIASVSFSHEKPLKDLGVAGVRNLLLIYIRLQETVSDSKSQGI